MDYLYSPYQDVWVNGHTTENSSKEFKTSSKTEEEMKKLTIDDNFTEIQKATYILSKGQNFQKYAVYASLPKLVKEADFQGKFLQCIFDDVLNQEEEIQIEAAKSFSRIIREKSLDKNLEMKVFAVTLNILKIWSQPILIAWVEVFQEILNSFQYQCIEKDCNQLITMLSDHSQPKSSRYIAGVLIGMVSEKLKESFPSSLMEKVRALCQDSDIEIRKVMANEVLEKICFAIGFEKTEIYILEKIMELVYDGEINVKCAGIRLIFKIIDALSPEARATRITNLFIELLGSINEEVLKVISSQIGQIIAKLEPFLKKNPSYTSSILSTFKEYGTNKMEEIRKNFSYNFPAILSIIDNKQFDNYKTIYLNHLLNEKSIEVRSTAVSCLHEIMKLVGFEEAHKTFKDVIKALLKENNQILIKKFIEHINDMLEALYNEEIWNNEEYVTNFQDILGYLINLGNKLHKDNQWREQHKLLTEFSKELKYFKIAELNEKYLPFLQNLLKNGVYEIRKLACLALIKFLKVNYYEKKRVEIVKYVNEQFFKSKSYFNRMVYLDFVYYSALYLSQNFLKLNIIPDCFKLASDRVANVRRRLAMIMVAIRKRLDRNDKDNLNKFYETLSNLKKDLDLDVSESTNVLKADLAKLKFEDDEFIKSMEVFEAERMMEDDELKILEFKENEDAKKKDSIDMDLFYPSNYYTSILSKSKQSKNKTPGSAGINNYRFSAPKNLTSVNSPANLASINNKFKSNKEISTFSPSIKAPGVTSSIGNIQQSFSPQPHKNSLILQASEKNVINVKKLDDSKKNGKDINSREIFSASKPNKPVFESKMTKFSIEKEKEKEKEKKSPVKKKI